jgi:hypothetical protein
MCTADTIRTDRIELDREGPDRIHLAQHTEQWRASVITIPDLTRSYSILPDPTRSYPILLDPTRSYPTLPDPTRSYPILPDPTRSFPTLPDPSRPYPILPDPTRPYPTLPDPTRSYPTRPDLRIARTYSKSPRRVAGNLMSVCRHAALFVSRSCQGHGPLVWCRVSTRWEKWNARGNSHPQTNKFRGLYSVSELYRLSDCPW